MADDPVKKYLQTYGGAKPKPSGDSAASKYLAKYGTPPAPPREEVDLSTNPVSDAAANLFGGLGIGASTTGEGLARLGEWGAKKLGADGVARTLGRVGDSLDANTEAIREAVAPETTAGGVAQVAGNVAYNVAQFGLPGGAAARAVKGAGRIAQAAASVAGASPLTAAQAARGKGGSTTELLAEHTDSPFLDRMASSAGGRIAGDLVADAALAGTLEAIPAAVRGGKKLARKAGEVLTAPAASAGNGVREAREGVLSHLDAKDRKFLETDPATKRIFEGGPAVADAPVTPARKSLRLEPDPSAKSDLHPIERELLDKQAMERAKLYGVPDEEYRAFLRSRAGSAAPEVQQAIAGAGVGAAVGASQDKENRLRGALIGGSIGAALPIGYTALRARRAAGASASAPAYMTDPDVQAIRGTISTGQGLAGVPASIRARVGRVAEQAYTRLVDELYPLKQFGKRVGGSDDLADEVTRASGWKGAAESRVRTQFKAVLESARGHEDGVSALAKSERIIELAQAGKDTDPQQLAAAQATAQKLSQIPEVRQAVDQLRAYYRDLLDHKLANGVIDQDMYDAIVAKGQAYVPMLPEAIADMKPPTSGGGKLVPRTTGVRKMTDFQNTGVTVDPFQQAVLDTYEAERTVSKQRVTNIVAAIQQQDPQAAAPFIRHLQAGGKAVGREVAANLAGHRQRFDVVDKELEHAWSAFDTPAQTIFTKALQPFKRALQTGVTLLPDFALANTIRDNVQVATQYGFPVRQALGGSAMGGVAGAAMDSDNRARGFAEGAGLGLGAGMMAPQLARAGRAIGDIVGRSDLYEEWLREGGSGFAEFYARPKEAAKLLADMRKDKATWSTVVQPRRWVDALQFVGRVMEEAPRVARYRSIREAGLSVPKAIAESKDISLNFARIGRDTKGLASVTAFFNAKVQGWDKLARMLKNPKTYGVAAATITAPSIALWSVNKDNPEYWERPQWERNMFWLVPRGEGQGFVRVPKPFELGFLFASLPERMLDFAYQQDPETLTYALKDMLNTTGEGTVPIPTALEPLLENTVNYDFFTNRPVVGRGQESLPKELQYDNRTSSLAVGLGKLTGQSPQQIDNLVQGYGGSAGQIASGLIDRAARASGVDSRPLNPTARTPLVGRFVTRPDQTSDAEETLRRRFAAAESAFRGAKRLYEEGDMARFKSFVQEHKADLAAYPELKQGQNQLLKVSEARRELLKRRDLTAEQKRQALVRLAALSRSLAAGEPVPGSQPQVAERP